MDKNRLRRLEDKLLSSRNKDAVFLGQVRMKEQMYNLTYSYYNGKTLGEINLYI